MLRSDVARNGDLSGLDVLREIINQLGQFSRLVEGQPVQTIQPTYLDGGIAFSQSLAARAPYPVVSPCMFGRLFAGSLRGEDYRDRAVNLGVDVEQLLATCIEIDGQVSDRAS